MKPYDRTEFSFGINLNLAVLAFGQAVNGR